MKPGIHVFVVGLVASCSPSSSRMHHQPARITNFSYDAPDGWTQHESRGARSVTTMWTPEDNDRKESVVIIRTTLQPVLAKAGLTGIMRQLAAAQQELPHVVVSSEVRDFTTSTGLGGLRLEDEFVPPGQALQYHRAHAVLVDGNDLIHVLYTARDEESQEQAFNMVVNSLRREEG